MMEKVRNTVAYLNPDQVPVIAAAANLCCSEANSVAEQYGEDTFVIMFGGRHIEMAALKSIGTLLQSSGWTGTIVEAEIASSGTAESYLSVSSVTGTRQMHQITACSLCKLMTEK